MILSSSRSFSVVLSCSRRFATILCGSSRTFSYVFNGSCRISMVLTVLHSKSVDFYRDNNFAVYSYIAS